MKVINQISDTIDIHIKRLCNCLSPVQRLVITVILFVIFFSSVTFHDRVCSLPSGQTRWKAHADRTY